MVQRTMRALDLAPWWKMMAMMATMSMERHQSVFELVTIAAEPNTMMTGHQDTNSTMRRTRLADTTSLRSSSTRDGDGTTSWTSTSRSSWRMMQSTLTCSSWRSKSWQEGEAFMNSPEKRKKDELGAHYACNLGFESQDEKKESSSEVGLHKEKKVAYFGFESQRKERMRRTRWPQVRQL